MALPGLLLDEHLAHDLADALMRNGIDAVHVSQWEDGSLRTADDDTLLTASTDADRVLVTMDGKTLPPLALQWVHAGRTHAGLIVLSSRIRQDDVRGQLRAVIAILSAFDDASWENRTAYARRS